MAKKSTSRKQAGDKAPSPAVSRRPAKKRAPLRVPQHGNGLLRVGNPGNAGGGRPKSVVRAAFLQSLDQRLPVLESIADGAIVQTIAGEKVELPVRVEDRIKAISAIGRVALSTEPDELAGRQPGGPTFVFVVPGAVTPDEWMQRYAGQQQQQLPPGIGRLNP